MNDAERQFSKFMRELQDLFARYEIAEITIWDEKNSSLRKVTSMGLEENAVQINIGEDED